MTVLITNDFLVSNIQTHEVLKNFLIPIFNYLDINYSFAKQKDFNFIKKNQSIILNMKKKLTKKEKHVLLQFLKQYDLILIYEASIKTREFFETNGIVYIDIWVAPIRFCKDVFFSFYSNDKKIQKIISQNRLKKKYIKTNAKTIKDNALNFLKQDNFIPRKNSALLVGQLFYDKSVFNGEKFLTLLDFKNKIRKLSKQYSIVYFLKHPLMDKKDFNQILENFKDLKNIEYKDNINTYYLLSQKNIKGVISISSSVLEEAKYFNKKIHYLYKPVLDYSKYIFIYKKMYSTKFWKKIFRLEKRKAKNIKFLVHDNYLRYNFSLYYAYKDFMNDVSSDTKQYYFKLIKFYKFSQELDKTKKYILYGYGSVGKLIFPHVKHYLKGIIDKNLNIDNVEGIKFYNNIDAISRNDTVIITPFLYEKEICQELSQKKINYIKLH